MFDWIGPLTDMIQDATNGPRQEYEIPSDIGISYRDIQRRCKAAGIKVWGGSIVDGKLIFSVKKEDESKADRILSGTY